MQAPYYAQDVDEEDEILADAEVDFGVEYAQDGNFGENVNAGEC